MAGEPSSNLTDATDEGRKDRRMSGTFVWSVVLEASLIYPVQQIE